MKKTSVTELEEIPGHLMEGLKGKEFPVNNKDDEEEVERVVKEATVEVLWRTGGAGFPLLCLDALGSRQSDVKRGVERANVTALVYHYNLPEESCSEVGVEEWIMKRRSGEEERVLIADDEEVSRNWECSHVLVVDLGRVGFENLVMRTVGYCALVKQGKMKH